MMLMLMMMMRTDKEEYIKRTRFHQKSLQRLSRRLAATADILEACRVAAEEVFIIDIIMNGSF